MSTAQIWTIVICIGVVTSTLLYRATESDNRAEEVAFLAEKHRKWACLDARERLAKDDFAAWLAFTPEHQKVQVKIWQASRKSKDKRRGGRLDPNHPDPCSPMKTYFLQ